MAENTNKKTSKKSSGSKKISPKAIGVGLALAAAAAGTYFLYGTKEGAKQRKKIKGWTLKAKGEVLEKLESLKDINEEAYKRVVEGVMRKYQTIKSGSAEELAEAYNEMMGYWNHIKKHLPKTAPTSKAKKAGSKASKSKKK